MRIEILARRLAEKTDTPILEQVVLGTAPVTDLSMECILWQGSVDGNFEGSRIRKTRGRDNGVYPSKVRGYASPVIRWQGKKIAVHRLIYQLLHQPDFEFRMRCDCRTPLCVNPLHWTSHQIEKEEPDPDEVADFLFNSDWTEEEVEEIIEILLTEQSPQCWQDVVGAPILEGAPDNIIRETLLKLNRGHLLP